MRMNLRELEIGKSGIITKVGGQGALRQHFLDMGMIPGAEVTAVKLAPLGDPLEVMVHGYELTLRLAEAEQIEVSSAEPFKAAADSDGEVTQGKSSARQRSGGQSGSHAKTEHPGLGEGGKYHSKVDENPLPENSTLTFGLVGNQNTGKTTLFNQLTGSNQHVGNFPGVTVDRKDGQIRGHANTLITDLPGIYSMSTYTSEELVTRDFVFNEHPNAIIDIVDINNIERNLYLTMQLIEMRVPVVVALNMMDEFTGNGGSIDLNEMEAQLGVPVVPISAARNHGVDELIGHAMHVAYYQEPPAYKDLCLESDRKGAVHRSIHAIEHIIEDHAKRAGLSENYAAIKLVEGDAIIEAQLALDENEKELIEHIVIQLEKESGLDRNAAIADMRYKFIERVTRASIKKPRASREHERSAKIDSILTGKYTAIPCFVAIMLAVFYLTFNVIGAWLQGLVEAGVSALSAAASSAMAAADVSPVIRSLVTDGIFEGVGSVLSFMPIIVTMFFFLSILEDSGYIARVAFVMDKLLRKIGLSGRSIVPMLIGFGCTVPAVMSTRTLPSERDRRMTILLTPFMSCSAKLPIYAFFVSAFFPGRGGLIMAGLYVLGAVVAVIIAKVYGNTLFKGEAVPFCMELPNYRLPGAINVARLLWDKAKDFLQRAFSVILIATIVVWFLQSFDGQLQLVADSSESIMASVAGVIAPLFRPIGLGDWRIITALISGFMAKESVVATMNVLFGGAAGIKAAITPAAAASILVFSLLYTPCVAAIAAIRRELGRRWAFGVVIWQCVIAWLAALVFFLILG